MRTQSELIEIKKQLEAAEAKQQILELAVKEARIAKGKNLAELLRLQSILTEHGLETKQIQG